MKRPRAAIAAVHLIVLPTILLNKDAAHSLIPSRHPPPRRTDAFSSTRRSSAARRPVVDRRRRRRTSRPSHDVPGDGPRRRDCDDDDDDDDDDGPCLTLTTIDRPSMILSSRRSILIASAVAVAACSSSSSLSSFPARAADDTLGDMSLGTATWADASSACASSRRYSSIPLSARIVPPSFATYLSRFLLHYDVSASAWWHDQSELYSLLPYNDSTKRECQSFGSYASSIRRGLYSYVSGEDGTDVRSYDRVRGKYSALLTSLTDKYGRERGAMRDIALLFAMLPPVYQPIDMLLRINKAELVTTGTNGGTNDDSFPPNYQTDFTLLLPGIYRAKYDQYTRSFDITPKINLFEIGIEEDARSSSSPSIATTFGPLSSKPLSRQRALSLDVYALLGISGGLGCASTHVLVIPLDVVKTRMQTYPGRYGSIYDGATTIANDEGVGGLFLGMQATIAGYLWYGMSVYPSYAFFKRYIGEEVLPSAFAFAHSNDVALVAGALASVIASLGLTPTEACRIRTVARPDTYRDMGLLGTMRVIAGEDDELGWRNLYAGLPSLMTRQVVFGSVKFLTFERASDVIFAQWPELRYGSYTALGVSLVAGGIAGVLSSIVSQPADSVLTYVAKRTSGGLGILDGAKMMVQEEGLGSLFRGLGSRSVWAGCIIAGQFMLYDVFRAYFGISGDDLTQVFELVVIPK